ncbi:MAG: 3-hydroxyacyl-CoA dehydrogenase family protein [Myxococcales bacterium]|nr:3-hydroxyacyl-CoA dehydrogenase family protein [Myxococcales bacterium]
MNLEGTAVAVIGTGTMGRGIAQIAAAAGLKTRLFDAEAGRAERAIADIGAQLEKLVQKGKLTADAKDKTLAQLEPQASLGAAANGADLIIEAVPESMELKLAVFKEAMATAKADCLLASNTSSLSLTELGTRLGAAERTVGMHFFNPPPVMELLEIVRGLTTSDVAVERALGYAKLLGKTPIVVNDSPGFATSRLGVILGAEAIRMLESGVANAADIDRAMELGYRHPMGPLKLTDLVGLDVRLAILDHLTKEVGEQFRAPTLLRTMVRAGKLGKKSGQGFYVWKDGVPTLGPAARGGAR